MASKSKLKGTLITANFGELWLRGKNRGDYKRLLRKNVLDALAGESFRLEDAHDRFLLHLSEDSDVDSISKKLSNVFGLSRISLSYVCKPELADIVKTGKELLKQMKSDGCKSVKVESHRSYKGLSFSSVDVIGKLTKAAKKLGLELMLRGSDMQLNVNVTQTRAFLNKGYSKGVGGLPVGSSGKVLILFSGGIDSPVAAWYAMKRGAIPIFVHFHPFAENSFVKKSKIPRLIDILKTYYPEFKSYYIPAYLFQTAAMKSNSRYESVLFKAFMFRVAEKIAKKEGAEAIYTGEALGQVASQTLPNMYASEQGTKMPIMRPLVGFDKDEIIRKARTINTYEESLKPYKDVCSIGVKKPVTLANSEAVKRMLKEINVNELVKRSLKLASVD